MQTLTFSHLEQSAGRRWVTIPALSVGGCCSYGIRRRHQVDTRGAGPPQRSLALDLDLTPQALDQRLKPKTMKVETLYQTVAQLAYSVRLVPNNDGESIEIEG